MSQKLSHNSNMPHFGIMGQKGRICHIIQESEAGSSIPKSLQCVRKCTKSQAYLPFPEENGAKYENGANGKMGQKLRLSRICQDPGMLKTIRIS